MPRAIDPTIIHAPVTRSAGRRNPDVAGPVEDHDRGFTFDRRRFLHVAVGGLALLAGCSSTDSATPSAGASNPTDTASDSAGASSAGDAGTTAAGSGVLTGPTPDGNCSVIPPETAGPYPGDGSNGPDVLAESGVVRSDIRTSIGTATGTAEGVELRVKLNLTQAQTGCGTPLAGAAVYIWHCDALGRYSMYSPGAENENYLRGVQESAADGTVTFTTIVPAAYPGRWPHIHFEVYPDLASATSATQPTATSQLAIPAELCHQVYAGSGYDGSAENLSQLSIETDMVFADSIDQQLAAITGSIGNSLTASFVVPV